MPRSLKKYKLMVAEKEKGAAGEKNGA
ncbi:hypothetical protein I7I53_04348 [Histoplasma capsulatum var. duboisii H88]|uniref:Uncharacterized protein n=1 Tax=Ajellomyces capsulatus (strain H88) TaxID=544711 RepID=A0A8A1LQJ3_AJEC8|nr:hypothetical protein I7I53_04348 [Histoplasma capsulatum var. duboisii H88]